MQVATTITLNADGKMNGNSASSWTYAAPWLELKWNNGAYTDKVNVSWEHDRENKKSATLVFSGLNNVGMEVGCRKSEVRSQKSEVRRVRTSLPVYHSRLTIDH